MSLVVFQHDQHEGAALLGMVLQSYGHRLRVINLPGGQAVPADLDDIDGIISMGGPMNVDDAAQHPWIEAELAFLKHAHSLGMPIVGVCLGAQLVAKALGGEVGAMDQPEVGWHNVKLSFPGTIDPLYAGITWDSMQFHMHGQEVKKLPPGGTPLSSSAKCRTQAFKAGLRTYAFQYHFEWDQRYLERMAQNELVGRAGMTAESVTAPTSQHYDGYRRQGERLCHNIASLLFPIDKR